MDNKVFIVYEDNCFDFEADIQIKVFSTFEKAKAYFDKCVNFIKVETESSYNYVNETETSYEFYDEDNYAEDHYVIYIEEKEVE